MFHQLVSAVQYCHQRSIVHRDLKPENIVIGSELNIEVVDSGFSKELTDEKLSTFCGTGCSMAPEMLWREAYDTHKVDIWILRVVLYRMVIGVVPFVGHNFGKLKEILRVQFHVLYVNGRLKTF